MAKMYNVLSADPAGEMFTAHDMTLQSFFLRIEGLNDMRGGKTVLINRKAGSPLLSGQQYLELTETPSKSKPGTTYYKAKLEKAPDGVPASTQRSLPLSESSEGAISWGQALQVAATLMASDWGKQILESETGGVPAVLSLAKNFFVAQVPQREALEAALEAQKDILPTDEDVDKPFDATKIPF